MSNSQLIPIESSNGVTIYGRIVNNTNRLGQYEVHSDFARSNGMVYHLYAEAEQRMKLLIGVKSN